MQVLLHVVNLLLYYVVDREVADRPVIVSRCLPCLVLRDYRHLIRRDLIRDALVFAARSAKGARPPCFFYPTRAKFI